MLGRLNRSFLTHTIQNYSYKRKRVWYLMVKVKIDMTGWKMWEHGVPDSRLTVIRQVEDYVTPSGERKAQWLCKCNCKDENEMSATGSSIKNGYTKSCGCLARERTSEARSKHRESIDGETRLYRIWKGMLSRCNNANRKEYKNYGGRGIKVCDEWRDYSIFKNWALQNGYNDNLTIERLNNNGNYEPSNCTWKTRKEQNNNRRSNHLIECNGETKNVNQWSIISGVCEATIRKRLLSGWSAESAIFTKTNRD